MKIHEAIQFDGKNIADIFRLPCVTKIEKSYSDPIVIGACVDDMPNGGYEIAYATDWICRTDEGWRVLRNYEYQREKDG